MFYKWILPSNLLAISAQQHLIIFHLPSHSFTEIGHRFLYCCTMGVNSYRGKRKRKMYILVSLVPKVAYLHIWLSHQNMWLHFPLTIFVYIIKKCCSWNRVYCNIVYYLTSPFHFHVFHILVVHAPFPLLVKTVGILQFGVWDCWDDFDSHCWEWITTLKK